MLKAYASGKTADAVGRELNLQVSTVREYLNRARDKFRESDRAASTRLDLYKRAVEDGLLPAPQSLDHTSVLPERADAVEPATQDVSSWLPQKVTDGLYRYILARMRAFALPGMAAEDVFQEVLVDYLDYRNSGHQVPVDEVLHFLVRITQRKLSTLYKASQQLPAEVLFDQVPEVPTRAFSSSSEIPPLGELLLELPDQQRDVLLLRIGSGLSTIDTADALGITPGAVRIIQHRALSKLKPKIIADALNSRSESDD